MFKVQQFIVSSSILLASQTSTNLTHEAMISRREHSLSPDSLEQRLLTHQRMDDDHVLVASQTIHIDNADVDDESLLTSSLSSSSSSSLMDSISIEQLHSSVRPINSTKTMLETLTSHGYFGSLSLTNDNDDDDLDNDLNDIRFDQNDVNLLFSDPDDGGLCRCSNEPFESEDARLGGKCHTDSRQYPVHY
jgi:hypothetical protein